MLFIIADLLSCEGWYDRVMHTHRNDQKESQRRSEAFLLYCYDCNKHRRFEFSVSSCARWWNWRHTGGKRTLFYSCSTDSRWFYEFSSSAFPFLQDVIECIGASSYRYLKLRDFGYNNLLGACKQQTSDEIRATRWLIYSQTTQHIISFMFYLTELKFFTVCVQCVQRPGTRRKCFCGRAKSILWNQNDPLESTYSQSRFAYQWWQGG